MYGICLKPGKIEKGASRTASCENIVIQNSVVYHGHGGFVIGSETYGGARNVFVRNCVFSGTDVGLRFKSGRTRGGLVEKIYIENVRMMNIVHEAILFDTYYGEDAEVKAQSEQREVQPVNDRTPRFREFTLSNITCNGAARAILINGLPEMPVEAISLSNVKITAEKGMLCVDAKDVGLTDASLQTSSGPVFSLHHMHGMMLQRVNVLPADKPFLFIGDSDVAGIRLIETEPTQAAKGIEFGAGAMESAVVKPH